VSKRFPSIVRLSETLGAVSWYCHPTELLKCGCSHKEQSTIINWPTIHKNNKLNQRRSINFATSAKNSECDWSKQNGERSLRAYKSSARQNLGGLIYSTLLSKTQLVQLLILWSDEQWFQAVTCDAPKIGQSEWKKLYLKLFQWFLLPNNTPCNDRMPRLTSRIVSERPSNQIKHEALHHPTAGFLPITVSLNINRMQRFIQVESHMEVWVPKLFVCSVGHCFSFVVWHQALHAVQNWPKPLTGG
jgi:hypothetical protein